MGRVDRHLENTDAIATVTSQNIQRLELILVKKVGQEELKELYEKFENVQKDWKSDLKDLKADLLAALKRP
jgi:predicted Rossmann fold nucleotide-binding protein DprA/Smf involved in DNA uptake